MGWTRSNVSLILMVGLFAAGGACKAAAQPIVLLTPESHSILAGRSLEILPDPDGRLSIHDVTDPAMSTEFRQSDDAVPVYGYSRAHYWLRLRLAHLPEAEETWFLSLANKSLDHVELYLPRRDAGWDVTVTGDDHPFDTRPTDARHFVFPIGVPDSVMTIYMRVASRGPVYLPVRLLSRDGFLAHTRRTSFLLGGLLGILLVLTLFHLAFYVAARDTSYLYYVGFLTALLLYNLAVERIAFQYLWPNNLWLADRANSMLGLLSFLFAIQFTRSFLDTRFVALRWDRALLTGMVVGVVLIALYLGGLNRPLAIATVIYFVVAVVLILVCAAIAVHRRQPAAKHYLVAWSFLCAGTVATMLGYLSVLPPYYFAGARGVQVGSAMTFTLFAVALGYRLRLMGRARRELRIKLASDLHDDVGAGLTEIALTSYLIRSQPASEKVEQMAAEIESRARTLTDTMRDIVWAVAPRRETWADLEERLRDVATGLLGPTRIDIDMEGTVDNPDRVLPLDVRQNILYIFKETVHNAVKHAECGRLKVRWKIERNEIHLHVSDDGTGFIWNDRHAGDGLLNIRRRVTALGGTMNIESEPGRGTSITVEAILSRG